MRLAELRTSPGHYVTLVISFASVDPISALEPQLRADLLDTWVAVTNAGGSVGFTAPAPVAEVGRTLDASLARVAAGDDALGVLRAPHGLVGMGLLVDRGSELCRHWRTVLRVMVHPDHQGEGAGRTLMGAFTRLRGSWDWYNCSSRSARGPAWSISMCVSATPSWGVTRVLYG